MKKKIWYTLEKHHNLWTVWKHHEEGHSVGFWGIFTDETKKKCLEFIKENKIKLGKRWIK